MPKAGECHWVSVTEAVTCTIVDGGADVLRATGVIDAETAAALKVEARRRAEAGCYRPQTTNVGPRPTTWGVAVAHYSLSRLLFTLLPGRGLLGNRGREGKVSLLR